MTGHPDSGFANHEFARSVVDEWARGGVRVAAVSPGSRSTPLALAVAADPRIAVEVVLDERSAAFFALGAAKAGGRPAVVLCTSGTAAANLHPAVLEAWHARVPLVVCTADRPVELRDTGAGQAADQIKLFGASLRWFCEVGAPSAGDDPSYWRSVAARAVAAAQGPPSGPVHLNVAFQEPLLWIDERGTAVGEGPEEVVSRLREGGRADGRPWVASRRPSMVPATADVEVLAAAVSSTPRGLLVAGWGSGVGPATAEGFTAATGWPVMADPISGLRCGPAMSAYDSFLRVEEVAERLRPDLVVHVGAALTGRTATEWLASVPRRVLVDPDGAWLDPHRSATDRIAADADALLRTTSYRLAGSPPAPPSSWAQEWAAVESLARTAIDGNLDSFDDLFEGRVARDLVESLPVGSTLVVGSSMPVRDLEAFARPRSGVRFLSNRGVNGIDGFTSTVLGVASDRALRPGGRAGADLAARPPGPLVALAGDLTFLHDAGALLVAARARRRLDATIVVVDNDGGGIFSFLPQAGLPAHFESLFGTPHGLDLTAVTAAFGVPAHRVSTASELVSTLSAATVEGGVQVVVAGTGDRKVNVARHHEVHQAVARALGPASVQS